jgi:hypothetical protein
MSFLNNHKEYPEHKEQREQESEKPKLDCKYCKGTGWFEILQSYVRGEGEAHNMVLGVIRCQHSEDFALGVNANIRRLRTKDGKHLGTFMERLTRNTGARFGAPLVE